MDIRKQSPRKFPSRCLDTNLYVGYIPGFSRAHSQAETIDALIHNLREVVGMLLEDGDPKMREEFIGTQLVEVA
ncbi:MAG: type II toxin-antitoxin system HicB family antitoxin [Pseudomonadota bacterium]